MRAKIQEIFSSVQGEGPYLGVAQIFIRFADCNLNCKYCDTPKTGYIQELEPAELLEGVLILENQFGPHHSVSLTGGEPLLHHEFLKEFLPLLKNKELKTYLETNGTLFEEMAHVVDSTDIISMDMKLPSSTGENSRWQEHEAFLKTVRGKEVFVKTVITNETSENDFICALDLLKAHNAEIQLVIQPATSNGKSHSLDTDKLYKWHMLAKKYLTNVRTIPQMHKLLGVR
ncbi:MAG: 7-carboxy-7-deazaguanine synthase QueE [Candidatus Omnitrophota bacterium]